MTVLSTDTCQRANQSGLGTASDGESYTINGTLTASISGNEATIEGSGGFTSALLGTQTTADINFLVRVTQNNNVFDGIGPTWRSDATGANCYFVALYAGAGGLVFAKLTSGGFSSIATGSFSLSTNTFYWVRVSMTGNHLQARIWQDGSSEPSTWLIDTTDSSYASAGRYGMSFNQFAGGTDTVQFDHITVTDNASVTNLATLGRATFKVRANLAGACQATWKIRAVLDTLTRTAFKVRASLAGGSRATWKIRTGLAAWARSTFKVRANLAVEQRAAFKIRARSATLAEATFKVNAVIQSLATHARATFKIKAVISVFRNRWKTRDNKATWRTRG